MAQYHHLTIYKASYEFLEYFALIFNQYSREYRFTIGERLLNAIIDFIFLIYKANSAKTPIERFKILQTMDEKMQIIEVSLRLSNGVKCLSKEKYINCAMKTAEISKQLGGWIAYTASCVSKFKIKPQKFCENADIEKQKQEKIEAKNYVIEAPKAPSAVLAEQLCLI